MAHTVNDCHQDRGACERCTFQKLIKDESLPHDTHFLVFGCPGCNFKKYQCHYCSATRKNSREKNEFRYITNHIEKSHPEKLTSSISLQTNIRAYDGMANDRAETEIDFLGHDEPPDDNLVNHLMNTMSKHDSGNQGQGDTSHEYSPPPRLGCKIVDLNESSSFLATKSEVRTFGKNTFADRTARYVEGSVASHGGCFTGWTCMIEPKLQQSVM